jgi:hypothetical protein
LLQIGDQARKFSATFARRETLEHLPRNFPYLGQCENYRCVANVTTIGRASRAKSLYLTFKVMVLLLSEASFTSPALSPNIARSSFSSGDGSDSPLGVIFPMRIIRDFP